MKKEIIPLGCNCHPAFWLKQRNIQTVAYPFDLLYSPAHLGMQYCVDNIRNNFSLCLESLTWSETGYCISKNYPRTLLFHHKALLSAHPRLRLDERLKLQRRIDRFNDVVSTKGVLFVYCYFFDDETNTEESLDIFENSARELLDIVRNANLLVYFMEDDKDTGFHWKPKKSIPRLSTAKYIRNTKVHDVWGDFPSLFLSLHNY